MFQATGPRVSVHAFKGMTALDGSTMHLTVMLPAPHCSERSCRVGTQLGMNSDEKICFQS